jgi:DNA-binding NarL/FixJ family response regulator
MHLTNAYRKLGFTSRSQLAAAIEPDHAGAGAAQP